MGKNCIIFIIWLAICFGQSDKIHNDSKFAIGLIGGLNYAIYRGDRWPEKTVSAPRINIGIGARFRLTSRLSNVCELSYLQLFYNTKSDYGGGMISTDHITFDNIYISSTLKMITITEQVIL